MVGFYGFAVGLWVLISWFEGFSIGVRVIWVGFRVFRVGECVVEFILKGFVILRGDWALVELVAIQLNVLPVFSGLLIIIISSTGLVEFIGRLVPDIADGLKLSVFPLQLSLLSLSAKRIASQLLEHFQLRLLNILQPSFNLLGTHRAIGCHFISIYSTVIIHLLSHFNLLIIYPLYFPHINTCYPILH